MTKSKAMGMAHELYSVIAGSIASKRSIEETVDLIYDIIKEHVEISDESN